MSEQKSGMASQPVPPQEEPVECPQGSESACGACCASASGAECCAPAVGRTGWARMLLFLLIVGAAAAVLTHALWRKAHSAPAAKKEPPAALIREAFLSPVVAARGRAGAAPQPAVGGGESVTLASLGSAAKGKEAVFVLLPGPDRSKARATNRLVEAAVRTIEARGRRAGAVTLAHGDPNYARLTAQFAPRTFPCVVTVGAGCGTSVLSGEITEAKLLAAFVAASQPSPCGPSGSCSSSGCG